MILYSALGLVLLINLGSCTIAASELSSAPNVSARPRAATTSASTSNAEPIWFSHIPDIMEQSTHDTSYLYCKMAHNGRAQWTVSPSESSYDHQSHGSNSQQQCTKCFCLPDTQRIGCVRTSCTEATTKAGTSKTGGQLQNHPLSNLHTKRSAANNNTSNSNSNSNNNDNGKHNAIAIAIANNKPAIYVNHEACIKAKRAIMAAHKCKSCACRQNGTLVCANDTNNPACGSFSFNKPVKRHPYSSLAPFVRRNNGASDAADKGLSLPSTQFSSYAECVRAHNGQSSFKQDCNSCACTKSGAVICTLMACPPSPLPTSSAPAEPTGTIVGSGTCTATSTSQSGSYAYQSYDQCVSANGGAHFKRECNFCSCISDGKVACTKMACPSTCH